MLLVAQLRSSTVQHLPYHPAPASPQNFASPSGSSTSVRLAKRLHHRQGASLDTYRAFLGRTREHQRAMAYQHGAQVFGFSVRQADQYAHYDWDQLTTVAWNTDPALMCMVRPSDCYPTLGW